MCSTVSPAASPSVEARARPRRPPARPRRREMRYTRKVSACRPPFGGREGKGKGVNRRRGGREVGGGRRCGEGGMGFALGQWGAEWPLAVVGVACPSQNG